MKDAARHRTPLAVIYRSAASFAILLLSLLCLNCGTRTQGQPTIEFTRLPPFGTGNASKLLAIEGRVKNVPPGQKIVLYARSGVWWVQPLADKPFTLVEDNLTWRNTTHPGAGYAALLVKDSFSPMAKIDALPERGGAILAVASVEPPPDPSSAPPILQFAGYEWQIRDKANNPGGSHNDYGPRNASVDASGALHLRITGSPNHWTSAEVCLSRSLGYGTYRLVLRDLSRLEPAAVFTMSTSEDDGPQHEMDIELSRWGELATRNSQFVIQPYQIPANTVQFETPPGVVTFMLRWQPGRADFRAYRGIAARWDATPFREHTFTSGIPGAGNELFHLNLYVFDRVPNPLTQPEEVVIENFEHLP